MCLPREFRGHGGTLGGYFLLLRLRLEHLLNATTDAHGNLGVGTDGWLLLFFLDDVLSLPEVKLRRKERTLRMR